MINKKISVNSMAIKKNVNFSLLPKSILVYWKILGICPIKLGGDEIVSFSPLGILYSTILTLAYVICYWRAVDNRINVILPRETPMTIIADILALSVEVLVVVTSWFYCLFREETLRKILKMMIKIHASSKLMGMSQCFERIFKRFKIHMILVNLGWFTLCCCDHGIVYTHRKFKLNVWLPFNFPRVVSHNIMIMFVNALMIVEKYFYMLNRKIQNVPRQDSLRVTLPRKRNRQHSRHYGLQSFDEPSPLVVYGQMHSDLVMVTQMIANFFSLSIILVLLVNLLRMASDFYLLCLMVKNEIFSNWRESMTFPIISCWWLLRFLETVILISIADSTVNEANQTGCILHTMMASPNTEDYIVTGHMMSLRLLQTPLTIELWGLIQMRLSVVHQIVGMMLTYITIMMQFDSQNIN